MAIQQLLGLAIVGTLAACASSSELVTGMSRAPLAPAQVTVYTSAPPSFEEVARFSASRESVTSAGGERVIEKMIASMRAQAAHGSISVGVGAWIDLTRKIAKARAIYVPPVN